MTLPTVGWLCQTLDGEHAALAPELPLGPIAIDTRTLTSGDTFWALPGGNDGHSYVAAAFAKGAKAAVVKTEWFQSELAAPFRPRLIVVPDTHTALTKAAVAWRACWTFPVLGITGTNGKTSTKDLLLHLLEDRVKATGTQGNFNNEIGVPLTLLATPLDIELAVVEMGASHAGDIAYLCNLARPTHGLVTSIGRAHLLGFGDLETVARTKGELYDAVAVAGTALVPTDDALCVTEAAACRTRIGYGFQPPPASWDGAFHAGETLAYNDAGQARFCFHGTEFALGVPGWPAALSALAALTVAHTLGIETRACREAVLSWNGVHGRLEVIAVGKATLVDDSYNANPTSMRAALETLSLLKSARRVAILGDMNELGAHADAEHRSLGRDTANYQVALALFVGEHAPLAAEAAQAAGIEAQAFRTYEELAPALAAYLRDGDAILVKGSRSMRLERAARDVKEIFG